MALIWILGSDPALGIKTTDAGRQSWNKSWRLCCTCFHAKPMVLISILVSDPALGIKPTNAGWQSWSKSWRLCRTCFHTKPMMLIPILGSDPDQNKNCSWIAIQHWELCKSKSDPRFGIRTFGLVCEHVHHYFWKLLQDCHPALGTVQEQIWSQIWNQHPWFSMWACASLLLKTAPRLPLVFPNAGWQSSIIRMLISNFTSE